MTKKIVIQLIEFYRKWLSPLKLRTCRFYPSCSEYAKESVSRFGVLKGMGKSAVRILKCHPFHPGGYDPAGDNKD
ncbi:MAG: membrane protein insertion efficiency factor YidD [Candidatus Omnitrophota bacterium]